MTMTERSTLCPMCGHELEDHIPGVAFGPYVCLHIECDCSFPQTVIDLRDEEGE